MTINVDPADDAKPTMAQLALAELRDKLQATLGDAFTIERELGGSGMSRVFVATEAALGRPVVFKVIAPELAEGMSVERFAREVRLAARLQQANIVPLLTAGNARGIPYYTMPFVDGESLRHRMKAGPVPVQEAISILRDVARALAYAHTHGVVHRDIKPENILLSGGAAVVTDFGIAKAFDASRMQPRSGSGKTTSGITLAGASLGTPAYMAPEQALADPHVDHRADLYSWGVMAWELLGGAHPFARWRTFQALVAAHVTEAPASLSAHAPGLPPGLAAIVMRAMSKEAKDRPQSAQEIIAALDEVSAVSPGPLAPELARGPSPASARWPVVVAAVAVIAGLVALMVLRSR
jgi:eukaryotic-like serine/threonine-protein kinase